MANLRTRNLIDRVLERATELSRVNATGSGLGSSTSSSTLSSGGTNGGAFGGDKITPRVTQPIGDGTVGNPIRTQNAFMLGVDVLGGANAYLVVMQGSIEYSF